MHLHRVDPGRLVADLRHVVVPLHRGLGVDAPGLGGVEVVHPRAHRVLPGALERAALCGVVPHPIRPIPIRHNPTGPGPRAPTSIVRQRPSIIPMRRIIVYLQSAAVEGRVRLATHD